MSRYSRYRYDSYSRFPEYVSVAERKAKAAAIMERNAIAASRRVRGLGPHQQAALTREFG